MMAMVIFFYSAAGPAKPRLAAKSNTSSTNNNFFIHAPPLPDISALAKLTALRLPLNHKAPHPAL
jgi:hypothetical protein